MKIKTYPTYVLLTLAAVIMMIPIIWMILGSFEPMSEILSGKLIPNVFEFHNYSVPFTAEPFSLYFINSFFTTGTIVVCQLATSALAAYGLVFTTARWRNFAFVLVMLSLMIPIQAIFIPDYVILSVFHWINTYQALIVPFIGTGFGIFFLRQAFLGIPAALVEAMKVDGASHWTILTRLVMPNAKASLITLAILNGVFHYGYLFWPLLVTNTDQYRVIPVGLSYLAAQEFRINWNVIMAASLMSVAPVVAVFLWGQRYILKGGVFSGIKG